MGSRPHGIIISGGVSCDPCCSLVACGQVLVNQNTTLAVMAFQAPDFNPTEYYGVPGQHYLQVQIGENVPQGRNSSYHSGNGSSLDGLFLPEGAILGWHPGGRGLNITDKGFAICSGKLLNCNALVCRAYLPSELCHVTELRHPARILIWQRPCRNIGLCT